jgi:hypothetical protein
VSRWKIDPAALMIGIGGVVLVVAIGMLLAGPGSQDEARRAECEAVPGQLFVYVQDGPRRADNRRGICVRPVQP